jgi:hypothetical protein
LGTPLSIDQKRAPNGNAQSARPNVRSRARTSPPRRHRDTRRENAMATYYAYIIGGWAAGITLAQLAVNLGTLIGTVL